jgi:hypothetical protein
MLLVVFCRVRRTAALRERSVTVPPRRRERGAAVRVRAAAVCCQQHHRFHTELLLDNGRSEIAYVVVIFKKTRGKYRPLPWLALQPDGAGDGNGRAYLLQADRQTRLQAPGFRRDARPDLTDRDWSRDVDRYWGRMVGRDAGKANRLPPPSPSH